MKKIENSLIYYEGLVCIFLLFFMITGCSDGDHNAGTSVDGVSETAILAQCLTEKGVVMYGTEWCPHCQNQKRMFGDAFKHINFVDCDMNSQECNVEGIRGYPTWKIKGSNYPGEKTLDQLRSLSGCEI